MPFSVSVLCDNNQTKERENYKYESQKNAPQKLENSTLENQKREKIMMPGDENPNGGRTLEN